MHGLFKKNNDQTLSIQHFVLSNDNEKIHLIITFDFTKKIPNNHGIELSGIFFISSYFIRTTIDLLLFHNR